MGEMSDRVIDATKETASDALESGKQIAHDAADTAKGKRTRPEARSWRRTCRTGLRSPPAAASQSAPAR